MSQLKPRDRGVYQKTSDSELTSKPKDSTESKPKQKPAQHKNDFKPKPYSKIADYFGIQD